MFDACILDLASQVYIHLRAKLAQDLKTCFGKDSAVAAAHNQIIEDEIQKAWKEAEDKRQVYRILLWMRARRGNSRGRSLTRT